MKYKAGFMEVYMVSEWVYESKLKVKSYARIILNLSRIGNFVGANCYKSKLSQERKFLKMLRSL